MLTDAKLQGMIDKIDAKDVDSIGDDNDNDKVTQYYRAKATENLLNNHRELSVTNCT